LRKTKLQLENELREIEKLISIGYTDIDIMEKLHIKRSVFYYYKRKISIASAELQRRKSNDILSFEQQVLKDRLVRLFRILESRSVDRNTRSGDVALCVSIAQEIAINILKLENEGLRVSSSLNYAISKAIKYTEQETRDPLQEQSVATTTTTEQQQTTTTETASEEEGQEPNNN
jgi:hypothetical protein